MAVECSFSLLLEYLDLFFIWVVPRFGATFFHLCTQINNHNVYRYEKEEYTD